jgi:phage-related protein
LIYLYSTRRTIIAFGNYYGEFIKTLNEKAVTKLKYLLLLLETVDRLPMKFIKYIRDGLYELRMNFEGNIYRLFFIFDGGNVVVLFNGFRKKTQKTPENEIRQAFKIKEAYYEYRHSNDNEH